MNKNYWFFLTKLAMVLAIIGVVVGVILQAGANHPRLRFPSISDITTQFITDMGQSFNKEASLRLTSQGPFKWDNEKDLGFTDALGEWANTYEQDAIVYFRRDKDAVWQEKALRVMSSVDQIADELSDMMGKECFSAEDANGRKLPIYLPETAEEYNRVVNMLCDGHRMPTKKEGCSILSLGPLGCKSEGIVIHPDTFNSEDELRYVLRKEMARYAYVSSMDYNESLDHQLWFVDGLLEHFANPNQVDSLSQSVMSFIEGDFDLLKKSLASSEVAQGAGAAFFDFLTDTQGKEKLSKLIQDSFTNGLDDAFSDLDLDFDKVKGDWLNDLLGIDAEGVLDSVRDAIDP